MTQDAGRSGRPMGPEGPAGPEGRAVLLVAGLADLAVTTLGSALGVVSGLLRRSDAAELASEAEQDLMARGRLALDRYAAVPPAHLELLARHVTARETDGV
ncbi:polyprenyl synthetase [Streptomyces virginiae]|uniref:polyprenyl synthetase n=1 Tax=Streptomyces virginiae TaxID=1961 RepID=UPI0035E06187